VHESVIALCSSERSARLRSFARLPGSHNKSLEPTPVTKARFFWPGSGAAQPRRWA
jgi:hypothetical protein